MITTTDGEEKGFTLQWKIENVSHWWWLKTGERIESPTFITDVLGGTKWSLFLYPMGYKDKSSIAFFLNREEDCNGPHNFKVNFQLSILGKDNSSCLKESNSWNHSFKKGRNGGLNEFVKKRRVFVIEREAFLSEDSLTFQCTMWITNDKPETFNYLFVTSAIKVERRSFLWKMDKVSTLKTDERYDFEDYLICFNVILHNDNDGLDFNITPLDETIKYISCNTFILESNGKKKNCEITKYFPSYLEKGELPSTLLLPAMLRENKSKYLSNDFLRLNFELVIAKVEQTDYRKNSSKLEKSVVAEKKYQDANNLNNDLEILYRDAIFSDMELRTPTKSFPVHKGILSSRSPVFKSMFSHDMMEKNSGHVEITDFDDDTIHRMLLYIYTDLLGNLQSESACNLFKIADKYQIQSLKIKCSSFLEDNLTFSNVCSVLVLADLYNEDDLKNAVQDYVLRQSNQIFSSQEWEDFMSTHVKLAADIMRRKLMYL